MPRVDFEGKNFCFTGTMSELKRTVAEREVRSRNGLTQKVINPNLDYLVIGSIPSPNWKFGKYGTKINKAMELAQEGAKTRLVSEDDFMQAIEKVAPIDSGEIDEKILIYRYESLVSNGEFDIIAVEDHLKLLSETKDSHVTSKIEDPRIYKNLYQQFSDVDVENLLYLKCRVVKHFPLEANTQEFADAITAGFELIEGLDGEVSWSDNVEGSANYAKLIKEIPQKTSLF